ncbi:MAG TPA: prolyl oligopeptidase family serine peptidase [Bacteroidales bacterium]|nr:prolyl oligopeptidase family serine peptidase [Bacteroidales bacterium]HRX97867.1 prolyl oligopeptidase family serine peptidase [Bacteroidales bacterium]
MKRIILPIALIGFLFLMSCEQNKQMKIKPAPYPVAKKVDTVDVYFGHQVADPYRWLEDDNSPETEAWVNAENEVTFGYLEQIPFRNKIKERLEQIWDYPKYGVPFKEGNNFYFFKNDGMQNQYVIYKQTALEAEPEVFLDPNTFSEDGTVALSGLEFNHDGTLLAYSISKSGSDWSEIYVMDVETKNLLDDHLEWIKFSGTSWKGDGFYYSRYDEPKEGDELKASNEYHKVYYHKIGTAQSEDKLIYKNDEYPKRNYYAGTTDDESFLFMSESAGTSGNALWVKKLDGSQDDFTLVAEGFENEYNVIDNLGEQLLIMTNDGAPKWQLVLVDPMNPEKANWKVIIPEKEEVLQSISLVGDKIVAEYMKNATSVAFIYDYDGNYVEDLQLPGIGSMSGISGKKGEDLAFYSFTSFTFPSTVYKYSIANNSSEVYTRSEIDFDVDNYETKQVFYKSKDGTEVSMFIVHKKGLKMNGKNPTYLYGYGGFNISLTPGFSITRLVLLENGFVFAMPNLRGGGEYGEEWHEGGTKTNKQNVFDDFIAAADYLIETGYTQPAKLAIAGGSNGGLLVGACMTQRPDLFAVALPAVGVMDMLRYHKFTIGWAWASDYGTSEESEEMFNYLYGYSPVHNIKNGVNYPATLITTADHDDRVVPAHSFKFAATLQEKHKGDNPVLIRIDVKAGHGGGKPTAKVIEEYTDEWSFMMYNLGVTPVY